MKNLKRVMALLFASIMIISALSINTFASSTPTYATTLTVSGFDDGDTVNFYKILEYDENGGDYGGWKLLAPYDGIVGQAIITDNTTATPTTVTPADKTEAVDLIINNLSADLAGQLSRLAPATGITPTTNAGGTATLSIADDTMIGLYMAVITPQDTKNVYNPVFVSSYYDDKNADSSWIVTSDKKTYSDSAATKKSKVGITKKDDQGSNSYDKTWRSTRPGESVNYTVESTIPGFGPVFTDPVFDIIDNLTYLELVADPVLVSPAGLTLGTDYTVQNNTTGFVISFSKDYLKTVTAPTKVEITYEAVVTNDAPMTVNVETNEVWVKYTPDHKDQTKFNYEKDDTEHYTYSIDAANIFGKDLIEYVSGSEVVKIGLKADKKTPINSTTYYSHVTNQESWTGALAGAQFELLSDYDAATGAGTVYTGSPNAPAAIKRFDYGKIMSQADGRFNIPGLDAGTYYLREVKAPTGFIKDTHVAEIVIDPTFTTVTRTMYTDGNKWAYNPVNADYKWSSTYDVEVLDKVKITVDGDETEHVFYNDGGKEIKWSSTGSKEKPHGFTNTEGVELPSTGGIGTTIFYLVGAILVVGAGVVLVTRRRMSSMPR